MQLVERLAKDSDRAHDAVVTILCDSNKKYLSTDLVREEPVREGYWTARIELESFDAVP
jgi:cysteine synthase A